MNIGCTLLIHKYYNIGKINLKKFKEIIEKNKDKITDIYEG
jgi:hypothetical protein